MTDESLYVNPLVSAKKTSCAVCGTADAYIAQYRRRRQSESFENGLPVATSGRHRSLLFTIDVWSAR